MLLQMPLKCDAVFDVPRKLLTVTAAAFAVYYIKYCLGSMLCPAILAEEHETDMKPACRSA